MTIKTVPKSPAEAIQYLKDLSGGKAPDCHLHVTGPLSLEGVEGVEQITRLPSLIIVDGDLDLRGAVITNYNDVTIQSGTPDNRPSTGVKITNFTTGGDLVIKGGRTR